MKSRNLISIADFTREELWQLLLLATKLKKRPISRILTGRSVGLIFQKPSTRTAVSFAVGVAQLGGQPLILTSDILQIKRGETPRDTARVLARYLDAIVMRANRHEDIVEMAGVAGIPVINGLTDLEHPCQILADLLTIMERKKMKHPRELAGFRLSYLGDGNNMAHSWMLASALLGLKFAIASPAGYAPQAAYVHKAKELGRIGHGTVTLVIDPRLAVQGADAVYTDVWTSMGQESEVLKRQSVFAPYQVNAAAMALAKPNAMVMHCLPAHRGEEITDDVLEGKNSVVFDQAENRLHAQKAVLVTLMGKK